MSRRSIDKSLNCPLDDICTLELALYRASDACGDATPILSLLGPRLFLAASRLRTGRPIASSVLRRTALCKVTLAAVIRELDELTEQLGANSSPELPGGQS
jgi:hypothetical protein